MRHSPLQSPKHETFQKLSKLLRFSPFLFFQRIFQWIILIPSHVCHDRLPHLLHIAPKMVVMLVLARKRISRLHGFFLWFFFAFIQCKSKYYSLTSWPEFTVIIRRGPREGWRMKTKFAQVCITTRLWRWSRLPSVCEWECMNIINRTIKGSWCVG